MLSLRQFLQESAYIGQSKKAYSTLSPEAKNLIDSWESVNWTGGPLEKAIKENSPLAQEIERAFIPVRKTLGRSIKLYRGYIKQNEYHGWKDKFLASWTDDRRVAEYFAGLRITQNGKSSLYEPITDKQIEDAYRQYNKSGFVKFRRHIYKRNDSHPSLKAPDYYDIYTLSRNYETDGSDLVQSLKDDQKWFNDLNNEKLAKAVVLEENIPTEKIIWITNNLGSKEFIVRL